MFLRCNDCLRCLSGRFLLAWMVTYSAALMMSSERVPGTSSSSGKSRFEELVEPNALISIHDQQFHPNRSPCIHSTFAKLTESGRRSVERAAESRDSRHRSVCGRLCVVRRSVPDDKSAPPAQPVAIPESLQWTKKFHVSLSPHRGLLLGHVLSDTQVLRVSRFWSVR